MMKFILFLYIVIIFFVGQQELSALEPKDFAVPLSVALDSSDSPKIELSWPHDSLALSYYVKRKFAADTSWTLLDSLGGKATKFIDTNISKHISYEYYVKTRRTENNAFGYLYTGIDVPATDYRGAVLLLTERNLLQKIPDAIEQYQRDLAADGWDVVRYNALRTEQFDKERVEQIRGYIELAGRQYGERLKAIIILGRVAVPYGGEGAIDGHVPDHFGAWPADIYYATPSDGWTDYYINFEVSARPENYNTPGDGKFDNFYIPEDVRYQLGRIDFYNLPEYKQTETELIENYLQKNHKYRYNETPVVYKGLIDDNFGLYTSEAFAVCGFMNFNSVLKPENVFAQRFVQTLRKENYIMAYGCGPGTYESVAGVANIQNFTEEHINGVFTMILGSYCGDWDSRNNLLRCAVASSPSILTCSWAGRPFWFLHHMAMGETIGYATVKTQNNKKWQYESTSKYGFRETHTALLGDPTLRLHVADPPKNLAAYPENPFEKDKKIILNWESSKDKNLIGYNIYRSYTYYNDFRKINTEPVRDTFFLDKKPIPGINVYMVRAITREDRSGGTYSNLSQGVFSEYDYYTSATDNKQSDFSVTLSPNPARDFVNICIHADNSTNAELTVHDIRGRHITDIYKGMLPMGANNFMFDASAIPAGVYLLTINSGSNYICHQFTVVK